MTGITGSNSDATVSDIIDMLQKIKDQGKGDYIVHCNSEYVLARKNDIPDIDDPSKSVDLGGYC